MTDFNDTTYLTARVEHRCEECGRTIGRGERYSRTAAVWCSEFFTNVACLHCAVARFIVDAGCDWYDEMFYGGLSEHVGDCGDREVWSLRLAVCVARKWQRFDGAGLMALPSNPWPEARYPGELIAWATEGRRVAA